MRIYTYLGDKFQSGWHGSLRVQSGDQAAHGLNAIGALFVVVDIVVIRTGHPLRLVLHLRQKMHDTRQNTKSQEKKSQVVKASTFRPIFQTLTFLPRSRFGVTTCF